MAQRIRRHEDIDAALQRLIHEDLARARHELDGDGPQEDRIHRVRQRLKRVRSLIAVLKPALGDRAEQAKHELAGAAHLLAGARDADAAAASARDLRASVAGGDDAGLDRVVAELDSAAAEAHLRRAPVDEVRDRLLAAERALAFSDAEVEGTALFRRALHRSYRKGRGAMRKAELSLATPDLHQWRKGVKDLWHLMTLARKRLPKRTRSLAGRLHRLSDVLGLDHDHAMLAEKLALSPEGDPALMRQLSIIAAERRRLESEAFALGEAIYRRKPKRFARRARFR